MSKMKLFMSLVLGLAVVLGQAGVVSAAPSAQDSAYLTGTVQNVEIEAETVLVKLLVGEESQVIRISVETASDLGLLTVDEMDNPVVDESVYGTSVDIKISAIITEEKRHPVGVKIADFFSELFDVNYEIVTGSHSSGFGFGVITQALWITEKLGGDATFFQTILDAKKSGDYSLVALPDGNIPQNWGQLKKTVLKGEDDQNLGDVTSDKDKEKPENQGNGNPAISPTQEQLNGSKPETPPGQDKNKQNNGRKPAVPPGQNKDDNGKIK